MPQLLRTPACAARWNTWVTPSSSAGRSASWIARLDEAEPGRSRRCCEVRFLDRARVVVGEAVEPTTVAPRSSSAAGQVRADEAGRAGDERLHANTSRTRSGSRHGRPRASSAACTVRPVAATAPSSQPTHLVAELHPHRRQQPSLRPDLQLVVVPRRPAILAVRLDHRQRHARVFHLAIAPAERPQQVGARHLEPDEVVRVVDDAHLVGFGVADAHGRGPRTAVAHCNGGRRRPRRADRESPRGEVRAAENARCPRPGSSAPAATIRPALVVSMPPSTSIAAGFAACVEQARTRTDFRLAARDESLAAEPRVDRHHQHVVEVAGDLLERADRRRRVERHAGLRAELLDRVDRAVQVRQRPRRAPKSSRRPASTNASR